MYLNTKLTTHKGPLVHYIQIRASSYLLPQNCKSDTFPDHIKKKQRSDLGVMEVDEIRAPPPSSSKTHRFPVSSASRQGWKNEGMIKGGWLSPSTMSLNHQLMVLASVQLLVLRRASEIYGNDMWECENRRKGESVGLSFRKSPDNLQFTSKFCAAGVVILFSGSWSLTYLML